MSVKERMVANRSYAVASSSGPASGPRSGRAHRERPRAIRRGSRDGAARIQEAPQVGRRADVRGRGTLPRPLASGDCRPDGCVASFKVVSVRSPSPELFTSLTMGSLYQTKKMLGSVFLCFVTSTLRQFTASYFRLFRKGSVDFFRAEAKKNFFHLADGMFARSGTFATIKSPGAIFLDRIA